MTGFMHVMSFIGSAGCYVPVLAVVFWCVNPRSGAAAAILLTMSGALNVLLKLAIHAPRPYWTDPGITAHDPLATFGMPSGHAQGAAVAYGMLGLLCLRMARRAQARRRAIPGGRSGQAVEVGGAGWGVGWSGKNGRGHAVAIWVGVGVVVGLVGVSRVYLGVHSAGQVLAGWLVGAALLLAAQVLGPVVAPWWRRRRAMVQLMLSLAVSLGFLAPTAAAVSGLRSWRWPTAWARAIEAAGGNIAPITLVDGVSVAGTLFGVLAGLSWLARRGWFEPGGTPWSRIARVPIGAGGAGVILLCGWPAAGTSAGAFATCAAAGAWLTAGAPEVFVRLGLAARSEKVPTGYSRGALSARHF
jgi:membrane-associated phospholipid phosphatase